MNTSTPTPRSPEPLTPEERALAARLGRLGPHGMPPPALDAKILGAAHAAAGSHARPRRWPALLGLAATLALAIGVTWQMQPTMGPGMHDEAPRASAPTAIAETAAGDSAPAPAAAASAREAQRQEVEPAAEALPAPGPRRARGPGAAEPATAAAPVTAPARPAASALSAPPPAPPPPWTAAPAPASAPPATAEKTLDPAAAAQATRGTTARRMQDSAEPPQAMDAREGVASTTRAAAPAQDLARMPVAADRELAPAEWIERIRLRRDAGDPVGARDSLQLLRSVHPRLILPDDLRELADSQGDPP